MNEEQYRSLCEACDRVLLAPGSTIERMAIPWLHIVREHPVLLANYVELLEPANGVKAIGRQWMRILRARAVWFQQLGTLRSEGQPWFGPKQLPGRIDVLFVSHLLNASHAGQADDFYFGELPNDLVALGHSVVIALINHSHHPGATLAEKWKERSVPRVVLSDWLGIWEELALHRRLKTESLRLRRLAKKETAGLFRRVLVQASQEALSGGSRTTLRMAKQIGVLVAKLTPRAIVVIHEGHAWERVAFAAARSSVPEVRCIGYHHLAPFRLQHAVRRNLASEYNPDQILTAGEVSKAQLQRAPGLEGVQISVLGSNRGSVTDASNSEHVVQSERQGHSRRRACLVLPEGIASECHLLFDFALACALVLPEMQFIWRLHPIVTYGSLAAQNPKLRNLPRNTLVSEGTLEEDLARSRWALYRGTTAVVKAVVAGLRPIYLQSPGELTIDPLYELQGWRVRIATVLEFQRVIDNDNADCDADLDVQSIVTEWRSAKRYCEELFTPFDLGALSNSTS